MFQNSFVTRLNLRCPFHYNNRITYCCPKSMCEKNPLLCEQCMSSSKIKQQHYGHEQDIQRIDRFLQSTSSTINREKQSIKKLYKSILSQKQNQTLLSWQKQKSQHFQSIENHLNTLKFQIEEEINNIVVRFQQQLNREKENIYRQLQIYFQTYKTKFNHFAELTQPVVIVSQSFMFYQSKNNLSLKMMSLQSSKLNKWLNGLKFNLNRAQLAAKKQVQYINRVQNLGLMTNQLMDDLPRLRNIDFENQLPLIMKQSAKNVMNSMVGFRRGKLVSTEMQKNINNNNNNNINSSSFQQQNQQPSHIMRSTSMNYIVTENNSRSISSNNNNNEKDSIRRTHNQQSTQQQRYF